MSGMTNKVLRITLAAAAGIGCLFGSENISLTRPDSLVTEAVARIGRPLTPLSYAGVARRTTRRAVYGTAAVGVGAAAAYGARAGCVQVVNPYGQIVVRCP